MYSHELNIENFGNRPHGQLWGETDESDWWSEVADYLRLETQSHKQLLDCPDRADLVHYHEWPEDDKWLVLHYNSLVITQHPSSHNTMEQKCQSILNLA